MLARLGVVLHWIALLVALAITALTWSGVAQGTYRTDDYGPLIMLNVGIAAALIFGGAALRFIFSGKFHLMPWAGLR
jgi:hypothetical protein